MKNFVENNFIHYVISAMHSFIFNAIILDIDLNNLSLNDLRSYSISRSLIHCVPKKGGIAVVENENNELIPTRLVTGWRVCIDYRKLNETTTRKDHFPLSFMDQMLERLAGNESYCFLEGFSSYFQIPINPPDQEKTTFTCPYGTLAYRRIPFGLCNAPRTFQRLEVNRAKVDAIAKLPHPTTVKGVRSFLGHAGFYRRFIQDFSMIARPITHLLVKETSFVFSKDCIDSFETLKKKLTKASILVVPDWNLPLELMYFMGPFPSSRGNRYILVAVDYLSKWAEAKVLPTNDARVVVKFLKSLSTRFETPKAIISDHMTDFGNDKFSKVVSKYGVTHRLAIAYHPQTSGQVEVSNRSLKQILERTVGENHASWSVKLEDALWAFRTAYKKPIGCTPYKLFYGKSCHLPIELDHKAYWALKHVNFDLKMQIFLGKPKTCWCGPFTITQVFPYGTVELSQPNDPNFKVNGHRVKHYFGGDIPQSVVPDLQIFSMDK
nr:reverse transcriptase domain-containing protein [Tanacetum cinerariifolium]